MPRLVKPRPRPIHLPTFIGKITNATIISVPSVDYISAVISNHMNIEPVKFSSAAEQFVNLILILAYQHIVLIQPCIFSRVGSRTINAPIISIPVLVGSVAGELPLKRRAATSVELSHVAPRDGGFPRISSGGRSALPNPRGFGCACFLCPSGAVTQRPHRPSAFARCAARLWTGPRRPHHRI